MRKTIVTLVALCAAVTVNATVLRVSNVSGSTAPYSTVADALANAAAGDTIMLDASATSYGDIEIKTRVVLMGPGYWLQRNGIIQEAGGSAEVRGVTIRASGTVLCGITASMSISVIEASDVVIKRSCLGHIALGDKSNRCVIHQNFMRGDIGASYSHTSMHQITNNILYGCSFRNVSNCYIAYNTFLANRSLGKANYWASHDLSFEKNVWEGYDKDDTETNSYKDNLATSSETDVWDYGGIDTDVQKLNLSTTHGAFAGDSPYVISGLPSAPIIEDLQAPTTVEYGSMMNVTIKVGVQK